MTTLVLSITAAASLVFLAVHSLVRGREGAGILFSGMALLLAAMEICDRLSLFILEQANEFKRAVIVMESFLPMTLLVFALVYLRRSSPRELSLTWKVTAGLALLFPVAALSLPTTAFFYSPDLQADRLLFLGSAGYWFYLGIMIYCVLALVNLEATFAATSGSDRWRIKYEMMGISTLIAVLIFYFSQALLYRTINMDLTPIRSGVFIIAAFFIGYSRLVRGNGVRIAVSRYVVYRSVTLMAVGIYLVVLGLLGEGMLYLGIPFSRNLTIFIGFAGGILILTLLFSEQIRRRVRVFVNKHFYRSKHDYREEWLKFTERLACCSTIQAVHEAILTTYRDTFGLKGAALYIRGKTGAMRRVAHLGVCGEQREITVSEQLTSYFLEKGRILNAADGEYLPNADEDAFVRETEAGLIIPLAGQGRMEGLIVLCRQLVPEEFTYEDYDLMKTLAKQATLSLVNFSLSEELAETREISAIARISSFVIHDLKNQTATLSLLADNAEEHMDNPEFQSDFVKAVRNTLAKMLSLIQILRNSPEAPRLNLNPWDIDTLARDAVAEVGRLRPATSLEYRGVPVRAFVDGEEIRKVLFNLLINAVDAIGPEGQIRVEVEQEGKRVCLRVTDDGCGMTNDFMERQLFKPFRTTKKTGLGIGLYQCRQIVEAHGGTIEVASEQGKGSRFAVILPMMA